MCMLISMLVCPVWAGGDLHLLITRNMEKLANSLDGTVVSRDLQFSIISSYTHTLVFDKATGFKLGCNIPGPTFVWTG